LQIAIYKNGQIVALLQIIQIPLYRDCLQFIKTAKIIAILQIAIYKNGHIIAICKLQFIKTAKLMQFANY
jgi:hypothetical protein